ncbi:hypothetical protein DIPPA_17969 [Diplonema papillatum]|nr:hypothetical protein DIPPA_17969 [Diplonema papillatum]
MSRVLDMPSGQQPRGGAAGRRPPATKRPALPPPLEPIGEGACVSDAPEGHVATYEVCGRIACRDMGYVDETRFLSSKRQETVIVDYLQEGHRGIPRFVVLDSDGPARVPKGSRCHKELLRLCDAATEDIIELFQCDAVGVIVEKLVTRPLTVFFAVNTAGGSSADRDVAEAVRDTIHRVLVFADEQIERSLTRTPSRSPRPRSPPLSTPRGREPAAGVLSERSNTPASRQRRHGRSGRAEPGDGVRPAREADDDLSFSSASAASSDDGADSAGGRGPVRVVLLRRLARERLLADVPSTDPFAGAPGGPPPLYCTRIHPTSGRFCDEVDPAADGSPPVALDAGRSSIGHVHLAKLPAEILQRSAVRLLSGSTLLPHKTLRSRGEGSTLASNIRERQAAPEHETNIFSPKTPRSREEADLMPAPSLLLHERQASPEHEVMTRPRSPFPAALCKAPPSAQPPPRALATPLAPGGPALRTFLDPGATLTNEATSARGQLAGVDRGELSSSCAQAAGAQTPAPDAARSRLAADRAQPAVRSRSEQALLRRKSSLVSNPLTATRLCSLPLSPVTSSLRRAAEFTDSASSRSGGSAGQAAGTRGLPAAGVVSVTRWRGDGLFAPPADIAALERRLPEQLRYQRNGHVLPSVVSARGAAVRRRREVYRAESSGSSRERRRSAKESSRRRASNGYTRAVLRTVPDGRSPAQDAFREEGTPLLVYPVPAEHLDNREEDAPLLAYPVPEHLDTREVFEELGPDLSTPSTSPRHRPATRVADDFSSPPSDQPRNQPYAAPPGPARARPPPVKVPIPQRSGHR